MTTDVAGAKKFVGQGGSVYMKAKTKYCWIMKAAVDCNPVVEAYKRDVDRTLLRENLKLTPAQRLEKLVRFASFAGQLRTAGQTARARRKI